LDRKILADLAIWEPRTFKALVELAKAREYEFPQNPLKVVEKPSVITRGML
jgi:ribosomal protein L20, putative